MQAIIVLCDLSGVDETGAQSSAPPECLQAVTAHCRFSNDYLAAWAQRQASQPLSNTTVQLPSRTTAGQAVLYATRAVTRSDGAPITVRSNPLLVTLFEGAPSPRSPQWTASTSTPSGIAWS